MSNTEYLTAAETARLIRKQLKQNWPGQKFYVNTSTYAGGASIRVVWLDGPTQAEVDKIVQPFSGSGFDGMIDMKYANYAYLMPDGRVEAVATDGTVNSAGSVPASKPTPPPGARQVHFGADFIFTERSTSAAHVQRCGAAVAEASGWEVPQIVNSTMWAGGKERGDCAYFKDDWSREDEVRYFRLCAADTPEGADPVLPDALRPVDEEEYKAWMMERQGTSPAADPEPAETADEVSLEEFLAHSTILADQDPEPEEVEDNWLWLIGADPVRSDPDKAERLMAEEEAETAEWLEEALADGMRPVLVRAEPEETVSGVRTAVHQSVVQDRRDKTLRLMVSERDASGGLIKSSHYYLTAQEAMALVNQLLSGVQRALD